MKNRSLCSWLSVVMAVIAVVCLLGPGKVLARPITAPGSVPDYFETPNWAFSPPLRKFVDTVAGLGVANNLGQMVTVAVPDTTTYPGSDYYEIELVEYRERMHTDLPALTGPKTDPATTGGTRLRGYRQVNTTNPDLLTPHYLGPLIIAKKFDPNYAPDAVLPTGGTNGRPVRIKFTNKLPIGPAGKLFLPVDTTIMGAGPFEIDYDPVTKAPITKITGDFTENRATVHLHGGRTPWVSDGTAHQWITPAGETTSYPVGMSKQNVPDMPDPGPGSQTFYYTNEQSARLLFYHDHAMGITRLNVYAGEAAGYLIQDPVELAMVNGGTINGRTYAAGTIPATQVPLVIQDKTFVDPATIKSTDPTWAWGTTPPTPVANPAIPGDGMAPVKGDLWWPHVYMPAQNPYNPNLSGINDMGRWHYGPWFFPATPTCGSDARAVKPFCIDFPPVANPYYDPGCEPDPTGVANNNFCQPPEIPGTPNVSWGAEAFLDTMMVNGTVYPKVEVPAGKIRLRILNASHDRFMNLQLYQADSTVDANTHPDSAAICASLGGCAQNTEVKMVPAAPAAGFPTSWPVDGREGGVPDPSLRGPAWIQIGTEGGFLPAPVLLKNQPVTWNTDPTMFNFGNVLSVADGGGTLFLAPAERADVIVDFSNFAGKTLILYNDAPTAFPALDPHYDYYTGAPDRSDIGGSPALPPGVGPNNRTIMQINVVGLGGTAPVDDYDAAYLTTLQNAFKTTAASPGVFASGQEPIFVGQSAYDSVYNRTFPKTWPNWGFSRISDSKMSFQTYDGTQISNYPMNAKAIHDEMGASFDDYGRMSAKLGLESAFANAAIASFVLQNFVDPATEILTPDVPQIWRITHNGVDTHPIHFHLFDVQVLNRVGWDGFIRKPDTNELGWKDTVRVSPLEDTIVALRPTTPRVPFGQPDSYRPLNPTALLGSNMGFSNLDPATGNPLAIPTQNAFVNMAHEYTWHCHILSHEENDMMRVIQFNFVNSIPTAPTLTVTTSSNKANLSWTDATPYNYVSGVPSTTQGNAANEIGFKVLRASGEVGGTFTQIALLPANTTTYTDTITPGGTYRYEVVAYNAAGESTSSASVINQKIGPPGYVSVQPANTNGNNRIGWGASPANGVTYVLEESTNSGFATSTVVYTGTALNTQLSGRTNGSYYYRVKATKVGFLDSAWTNGNNPCVVTLPVMPAPAWISVQAANTNGQNRIGWAVVPMTDVIYVLEQSTSPSFTTSTVVYSGTAANTVNIVTANGSYYYRVTATKVGYTNSAWRQGANPTVVAMPTVAAPGYISVRAIASGGITAAGWGASPTAGVTYNLEESTSPSFTTVTLKYSGAATSVQMPGHAAGSYYYRVKATKAGMLDSAYVVGANPSVVP